MTTRETTNGKYADLVQETRVHGSLYTDPGIFADELARIWYRTWVCVGHTSEVARPGDYVRKSIGLQDLIMTRSRDGEVNLLVNRCAHRGATVCEDLRGNSSAFRCPYHGWTYDNKGGLLGYPYHQGYGGKNKLDVSMGRVPRVEAYQGFVFASFAPDGPSLKEHLGGAAGELDRLSRLSPEGESELTAGWLRHRTHTNWKMVMENETDGYHPQFVHGSIFGVTGSPIGALYSEKSTAVTRDLGGGHSENDLRPEFRDRAQPLGWFGTTEDKVPDYVARMRARYGEQAEEILIDGAPHVAVFPNLFIAEISVFMIQPVSVSETIQNVTAVQLKGAPDMNRRLLSQSVGSVGPAGMLLADDAEMYERSQRGVNGNLPEWLALRRGAHRERTDDQGYLVGDVTDETGIRGFWSQYRTVMEEG
ncbi:aromatic ring-hydroxylating dioxygenase subunit alpha [Streptomyces sp. NPDC004609]|uniref:aromatic ring-hydroxylating oxygenase subunit alpha n=1 Tax=Streptomyces sp. NPDC004609 TaxID=3364704 RepID=UPI0036763C99